MALIEVRDCHYETNKLDAYRVWAAEHPGFGGYLQLSVRFLDEV